MPMYSISFDGVAFRSFMSFLCLWIPFHLMVLHFDRLSLFHAYVSISFDDVAFRLFVFSMPMYSISFDGVAFRSFVFSMPMYSISFDGVAFRSFMSSPCLCIPFHLMVLHFDRLCLLHAYVFHFI